MSVDKDTVRRIASLARIAVPDARLEPMAAELNGIFQWVEMLGEVNVEGVPAMTSVVAQKLKWRQDVVNDGGQAAAVTANAHAAMVATCRMKCARPCVLRCASTRLTPAIRRNDDRMTVRECSQNGSR